MTTFEHPGIMRHHQESLVKMQQPETAKNVHVYLNGDKFFPGRKFVVNRRHIADFDGFLNQVTMGIKAPFGAVRNIYTPQSGHRVSELDQLQTGMQVVAGGVERFRKLEYKEIGLKKRQQPRRTDVDFRLSHHSRMNVSARWRKYVKDPCQIFVFGNGDINAPALRLLLIPRCMKSWDLVLEEITEKLSLRTGQAVRKLYDMDYRLLGDPSELENGHYYVAVGTEKLKKYPYGDIHKTLSPRKFHQPLPPIKRASRPRPPAREDSDQTYTKMYAQRKHRKEQEETTIMGASAATGYRPLKTKKFKPHRPSGGPPSHEGESVFHAKPVKVKRSSGRSISVINESHPPSQGSDGVFKATSETVRAEEVAEDEDTKVDLPIDQVPADEVEEEEEEEEEHVVPAVSAGIALSHDDEAISSEQGAPPPVDAEEPSEPPMSGALEKEQIDVETTEEEPAKEEVNKNEDEAEDILVLTSTTPVEASLVDISATQSQLDEESEVHPVDDTKPAAEASDEGASAEEDVNSITQETSSLRNEEEVVKEEVVTEESKEETFVVSSTNEVAVEEKDASPPEEEIATEAAVPEDPPTETDTIEPIENEEVAENADADEHPTLVVDAARDVNAEEPPDVEMKPPEETAQDVEETVEVPPAVAAPEVEDIVEAPAEAAPKVEDSGEAPAEVTPEGDIVEPPADAQGYDANDQKPDDIVMASEHPEDTNTAVTGGGDTDEDNPGHETVEASDTKPEEEQPEENPLTPSSAKPEDDEEAEEDVKDDDKTTEAALQDEGEKELSAVPQEEDKIPTRSDADGGEPSPRLEAVDGEASESVTNKNDDPQVGESMEAGEDSGPTARPASDALTIEDQAVPLTPSGKQGVPNGSATGLPEVTP